MDLANNLEGLGVYELLTQLCTKTSAKYYVQSGLSQKSFAAKLRSQSYEIILKKSRSDSSSIQADPIVDLISHSFVLDQNVRNVAEYKRCIELKKHIKTLRSIDFGDRKGHINDVLKFLIALKNSSEEDLSAKLFQNPFSFGLLNEMLPKPKQEVFGSPQPYSYFPEHIFELPYSLKHKSAKCYEEYTVKNFESKSFLPETKPCSLVDVKIIQSPISLMSMTSASSPYVNTLNFPRLNVPRDIKIPISQFTDVNVKVSTVSTNESDIKEVFRRKPDDTMDIWEIASQIDKHIPEDIWDVVSQMPLVNERQLLASSTREMKLWRELYGNELSELSVMSEKQFIRHTMYLIFGVETKSFPFCVESNCFFMRDDIILEAISKEQLRGYISPLLLVGTYYRRLYTFAFNLTGEDHFHTKGLIFEAAREIIRRYLLEFRLKATKIYRESYKITTEDLNCMPTLLQILYHMEPLKYEIETIASIYRMVDIDSVVIPYGAELMSYLFNEISLVTHRQTALTLFDSLFCVCRIYFKFIERFIFEGELDDMFNEFFIKKDSHYVNSRTKRYWDKGFHITMYYAVPAFLRPLASFILLCGKSLRLLKLCNPSDPLVLLISSDHPSVRCCANFEELERQQQLLDVYRTRCLFVSGEPVTFEQILLKREAEKKAFTEMASLKQAETMEKIVAERKRLAQLIIAEKQHSLRVLEAAIAEAKAAKNKAKKRERKICEIEENLEKATEEVDSKLKDTERNKIMEYYTKLNMEVEKSKIHTEWKIKRLQLDQSRIQLLSTEERNLKREKLELEHQRNESVMAMSIQSDFKSEDDLDTIDNNNGIENKSNDSTPSVDLQESSEASELDKNKEKAQSSNDVFTAICNVAKNIFGAKPKEKTPCDNEIEMDAQGNVIDNKENFKTETSNDVIGANLDDVYDNLHFLENRQEAFKNKQKVMAHEFGQTDNENNKLKKLPTIKTSSIDKENNIEEEWAFSEARKNKLKVLGAEFDMSAPEVNVETVVEPITEAQKEALINKRKILGVEYNLPAEIISRKDPANVAQEEAIINRNKVLGSEYVINVKKLPTIKTSIHKENTIEEESAFSEARKNKLKVLGAEFGMSAPEVNVETVVEPITEIQKEALINKRKILGVEYNLPAEIISRKEPANVAQEEAIINKNKVLGSEYDINVKGLRFDSSKKSSLRLNLKPYSEPSVSDKTVTTPNTGAITPGELFPGLDLETPTTAEIPIESAATADIFTPQSETIDTDVIKPKDKEYLTSDGFNFSIIVDDEIVATEIISDVQTDVSIENSPSKSTDDCDIPLRTSIFNILDGTYNLDNFDPFGVKNLGKYSKDYFNRTNEESCTTYTNPAILFEEFKKMPYDNIFTHYKEKEEVKVTCDNIATLTACLQRSVMLPLTYQLEVVNNSILTHFLVNLDMYEHLKSLKDYFFLMDGEFSRSICHNLFAKLTTTLNPQDLMRFATLHNILDKALGSSISHVNKFSENLSFTLAECPLSFQHSSPDVLQCLSLTYTVDWPLNIILSQEALLRYAKVFQFLIKMRRIFWVLSEDFEALKSIVKPSKENSRKILKSPQYISVQIYRHIMASLIRALDNYIVTTCILTSWTEFEKDLKKARTLDDLYECHVVYIKKVLFRCLLNNRSTPVMKLLNDIFTVILKFSRVLKAGEWQQKENSNFTHTNFVQLEELFHLFEKLAKYLHKVVTKLMECGYQRHLVELLTMINLNGYYDSDRSKQDTNVSLQSN